MNDRFPKLNWRGAVLSLVCALALAASAKASDSRAFTEEFHHSYPLAAGGRVELENVNGPVHITAWDRNEVKVDAVKYAGSKERLDEAHIEVHATANSVEIRTRYPQHDNTFEDGNWRNPAGVEYTLMVPRDSRLDEIKLINGSLDITGVAGEVRASCINGHLVAQGLRGRAQLNTINSRLEARFDQAASSPIELSSVNGRVELTLPSDTKGRIEASTVHGGIENDFGLHVVDHRWVGHELDGELGGGGTQIRLHNVNGQIEVHRAQDGKQVNPARDLGSRHDESDRDDDDDDDI